MRTSEQLTPRASDKCSNILCTHTYADHNPHPERGCLNCLCPAWNASKEAHEAVRQTLARLARGLASTIGKIV